MTADRGKDASPELEGVITQGLVAVQPVWPAEPMRQQSVDASSHAIGTLRDMSAAFRPQRVPLDGTPGAARHLDRAREPRLCVRLRCR
jgi:hypothetical protein